MLAAFRWLILGLLFWILADVAGLYHTQNAGLNHNFYTGVGTGCFVMAFLYAWRGK